MALCSCGPREEAPSLRDGKCSCNHCQEHHFRPCSPTQRQPFQKRFSAGANPAVGTFWKVNLDKRCRDSLLKRSYRNAWYEEHHLNLPPLFHLPRDVIGTFRSYKPAFSVQIRAGRLCSCSLKKTASLINSIALDEGRMSERYRPGVPLLTNTKKGTDEKKFYGKKQLK
jgi:hypothetical protein